MLAHLFNRFYVITKFILPAIDDLKLSPIKYDGDCKYLEDLNYNNSEEVKTQIKDLVTYCVNLDHTWPSIKCK